MNKKELIERIENMPYENGILMDFVKINRGWLLKTIKQLDEPEIVKVPQYVADWYEEHKDNLEYNIWDWMKYNLEPKKQENVIFSQWLGNTVNKPVETLIKMKLYGYEVEKEKRYIVTLKSSGQKLYYHTEDEDYIFSSYDGVFYSEYHTKTDLEENDMSWVFDCPGIEVQEVE